MKEQLKKKISGVVAEMLQKENVSLPELNFAVVIPDNDDHGDYATNVAMQLTKPLKRSPRSVAEEIIEKLGRDPENDFTAEIAGPGFINFKLSDGFFHKTVAEIIENGQYFENGYGAGKKIIVEFVSANPTGPLHIGHGRGAAYGDSLCRMLSASGYDVHREYYVNDGGNQMRNLGLSVYCRLCEAAGRPREFPENGYHGEYVKDIAYDIAKKYPDILERGEEEGVEICLKQAVEVITRGIEEDLKNFRVEFDEWFSENSLYTSGTVDKTIERLNRAGFVYENEGAIWLSTEKLGDDKDRVLKKSSGEYTYFAPDIAYHADKYLRGFDRLIDVWGADHHGYVKRMTCAVRMLGYPEASFEASLIQMVNLVKDGEKISMSTRSGSFIPLSWLIEEVGADAARFFYNMRSHDAQFDFDVDLAKSKTSDNPVYYIQYAHARVFSLLSNARDKGHKYERGNGLNLLKQKEEIRLIKDMMRLKYVVELAALHLEPHRVAYHLQELAASFHAYYYSTPIITTANPDLTDARLTLCEAVATAVKYGLGLLGVSAPERM